MVKNKSSYFSYTIGYIQFGMRDAGNGRGNQGQLSQPQVSITKANNSQTIKNTFMMHYQPPGHIRTGTFAIGRRTFWMLFSIAFVA